MFEEGSLPHKNLKFSATAAKLEAKRQPVRSQNVTMHSRIHLTGPGNRR